MQKKSAHGTWVFISTLFLAGAAWICAAPEARAAVVWTGDFETGDVSQWSGTLNGQHISVVKMPVADGMFSGQVQLTNDAVWPNGLKRVEFNHSPEAARTAEGAQTFFAWSFYLPQTLPVDPTQQIGYWESNQSYQQMMAFEVSGEHISFSTRQPQNKVQWQADGKVKAGVWHRIAMRIVWSKDPAVGLVDVWFDNEQVLSGGGAKTLADDNAHFTQVGLLRGKIEFQDAPVIVIDDAAEGDTLEDVRPDALVMGQGGAGGGGVGGMGSGGSSIGSGGAGGGGTAGAGGNASSSGGGDEEGGCSCGVLAPQGEEMKIGALVLLAGLAWGRKRRSVSIRGGL